MLFSGAAKLTELGNV